MVFVKRLIVPTTKNNTDHTFFIRTLTLKVIKSLETYLKSMTTRLLEDKNINMLE